MPGIRDNLFQNSPLLTYVQGSTSFNGKYFRRVGGQWIQVGGPAFVKVGK